MTGVHEDFGEKIGGAKKDLWKDRGLYADDLEAIPIAPSLYSLSNKMANNLTGC